MVSARAAGPSSGGLWRAPFCGILRRKGDVYKLSEKYKCPYCGVAFYEASDNTKERRISYNFDQKDFDGPYGYNSILSDIVAVYHYCPSCHEYSVQLASSKGLFSFNYPPYTGITLPDYIPEAIRKGVEDAKKNMINVALKNGTIPHESLGIYGAGKVIMRPAAEGTGIKAGGPVRAVLALAGVRNVLTKSLGSSNPINMVKATLDGMAKLENVQTVAALRGKTVDEIYN